MKTELRKSSLSGAAQFVISTILVVIGIPTFIRVLGTEAYGIFSLLGVVNAINAFAGLGLNSSLIRFLAAQGKGQESNHDIIVNFALIGMVLFPLTVCGILLQDFLLMYVLNVPRDMIADAKWLFVSMLLGNGLILLGQTFTSILDSQQKVHLTNMYQVLYSVFYWGLIIVVISLGYSLKGVAFAILVSTTVWFSIVSISALRFWGRLSMKGLRSNGMRVLKKNLTYGLQVYAGGLLNMLYEPLTKIFASHFLGITEVGLFDIGLRIRNQVYGLASKVLYPLYPMISNLADRAKIRVLVHDVEQKTLFGIMPLIAITWLITEPLVLFFFSTHVKEISITAASMVSAFLIGSIVVTPMYYFLLVKGYTGKTILLQGTNVLVNAVVFFACYSWLRYYALVAANAAAILVSCCLLIYYQRKYLNSLIFDSVKQVLVLLVTFGVALVLGYLSNTAIDSNTWKLVAVPTIVLSVTILLYRSFALISRTDVFRYLGDGGVFARVSVWVLCRS